MEIVIKTSKKKLLILAVVFAFAACDKNYVYDQYQALEGNNWKQSETVDFEFQISDTVTRNNLYINIRNNKEYAYSNLFLITQINFPDGKKIVDTLQYAMTDKKGRFLGSGLSDVKDNKLLFKENSIFPNSGNYKVSIQQAMRKNGEVNGIENLEGITDVGLRIEKIE